ncbi:hypothetical protein SmJEL517_g03145 [Synchytrium microbalum]|uniref:Ribosome biogenesis protein YTM1 n=1 Tax=Synchytrium microbalum TaxID=1806994 RepID=A0A507C8A4_9FUNG|nr:uncharacterized protein SmJEL517_g03145 [Synchytrium microbalum]TPX34226.1 hypothetical protein SmJEL517_g03145 [Synchytrium microbalum]
MTTDNENEQQQKVQVRFRSRESRYSVTTAPILVPIGVKRIGLSSIVNQLLNSDNPEPTEKTIPFDFLIENKFLRTSLSEYLDANAKSTESILEIEYLPVQSPPSPSHSYPHPDWIASIRSTDDLVLTGCFDGKARLWDYSGNSLAILDCGKPGKGIKAVGFVKRKEGLVALAGGVDGEKIGAWQISGQTATKLYDAIGHRGAIESLDVSPSHSHFASSSWDGKILYWTTERPTDEDDEEDEAENTKSGQKRKQPPTSRPAPIKTPLLTLEGHIGCVSAVAFRQGSEENILYSGGWDHSVRVWDLVGRSNTLSMSCESVVSALAHSANSGLIATGHSDSLVRLWDPRSQDGVAVKLKLKSHKGWVSSVSWSPSSSHMLASTSYDSTVKVWDVRSTTPLYTLAGSQDKSMKLFALEWNDRVIMTGGEQGELKTWEF